MKYRYREQHEMKDSGVEWLGMIPKEWEVSKLKYNYNFEKGKNAASFTKEYIEMNKGKFPVYSGQTENDGIMGKISSYEYNLEKCIFTTTVGAKVMTPMLLSGKFSLSQNCLIMRNKVEINNTFIYYQLFPLFDYQKSMIPSHMQPSLRIEDLNKFDIFLPTTIIQQKIADFLDKKCEEFDSVIAKKEMLINKLEEAKKSLISEVVTGKVKVIQKENGEYGIIKREAHEMKDSGVEWPFGMIPKEWEVKKLGYLYSFKNGVNADAGKYGKGIKFINVKEVINNRILTYDMIPNLVDISKELIKENIVKNGDILLNRTSETAEEIGMVTVYKDINPIVFGGFVIKGSQKSKTLIDDFKKYCFSSLEIRSQMISYASGSIRKNISQSNLKDIYLSYPKINCQKIIGKYLNEKSSQFDITIEKQKEIIEKLKSAKQSLISEAVTGKIEVL